MRAVQGEVCPELAVLSPISSPPPKPLQCSSGTKVQPQHSGSPRGTQRLNTFLPSPGDPQIPKAWLSYLRDKSTCLSEECVCALALFFIGPDADCPLLPVSSVSDVECPSVPTPQVGLLLPHGDTRRHWAWPQAPPAALPTPSGSRDRSVPRLVGRGQGAPVPSALSAPFSRARRLQ